jgi:thiol-disulfide isomerase/thioredoxin
MEPDVNNANNKEECNDLYCARPAPDTAPQQTVELVAPKALEAPKENDASRERAYDMILNSGMLVNKDGQQLSPSHLQGKHLLLYFSAHWCPPCREFTPKLVQTYKELQAAGKQVEVVFISSDKDATQFQEYLNLMPWVALPFEAPERTSLGSELGVNGIPCLIVFSPEGRQMTRRGVNIVAHLDPKGNAFPWDSGEFAFGAVKGAACMACITCLCCPCLCAVGIVVGILRCVFCVPCLCPPEQPGQPKK